MIELRSSNFEMKIVLINSSKRTKRGANVG